MTEIEKLKKLIPDDHGYTDAELLSLIEEYGIYKAAVFVLRSVIVKIASGAYSFSSGDVRIDKSKLVDNYQKLIAEYEDLSQSPVSVNEPWKTDMDYLSGVDRTDYDR